MSFKKYTYYYKCFLRQHSSTFVHKNRVNVLPGIWSTTKILKNVQTYPALQHVQGTGNRSSIVCDRYGILSCCQFYARNLMKMTIFFTCFRHSIEWQKSTGKGTHWRIELINLLEMLTPHRPCEKGRQIHTMSRWNSAHSICSWKHKNWAAHCLGSYKMLNLWYWLHQTLQKPQ